ncbi:hypothetical protein JK358_10025 [Nocardia sp. 2]|uniref:Uncharacterized protein n=1 Tax=Nocardia acididurans TaxID=2802282 RepID=A0ABS1M3I5_9NOCA|nr:hypothetical protein [Nocardia acididurans]
MKRTERTAVHGDVVNDQRQHHILPSQPEQPRLDGQFGGQIETPGAEVGEALGQLPGAGVHHGQFHPCDIGVHHHLDRPVRGGRIAGAQWNMPSHNIIDRRGHRGSVHGRVTNAIRASYIPVSRESVPRRVPHSLLRGRQRYSGRSRHSPQRARIRDDP